MRTKDEKIVKMPRNLKEDDRERFWEQAKGIILGKDLTRISLRQEIVADIPGVTVVAVTAKKENTTEAAQQSKKPAVELQLRGEAWRKNAISKEGRLRVHLGQGRNTPDLPQQLNKCLGEISRKFRRSIEKRRKGLDDNPISAAELQ